MERRFKIQDTISTYKYVCYINKSVYGLFFAFLSIFLKWSTYKQIPALIFICLSYHCAKRIELILEKFYICNLISLFSWRMFYAYHIPKYLRGLRILGMDVRYFHFITSGVDLSTMHCIINFFFSHFILFILSK